jgi:diguanylate cyclase (GGDEF)-like protein
MLLLGAFIVLPILALLGSMVHDLTKQIAVAEGEREGLTSIGILGRLFEDASVDRTRASAAVRRDAAAMDRREAQHALASDDWRTAFTTWRAAAGTRGNSDFIAQLTALFPLVSDRSGLTYDPDTAGIDLADSLTYRLPIAVEQLQRAEVILRSPGAAGIAGRLALAEAAGHARGYLDDGLSETLEASRLNRAFTRTVGSDQPRAVDSTSGALDTLAAFEGDPTDATRTRARAAVSAGIRDLYTVFRDTQPALGSLLAARKAALEEQRLQTILLGIIAILAASLIVVIGARNALHRAELSRMRRTATELEYHATHDRLTGLPNRTAFVAAIDDRLADIRRHGGAVAVLFIDLDNFKLVNDSLGHEAGDTVLTIVARRLKTLGTRPERALVARFGGDEFAMLLHDSSPGAKGFRSEVDAVVAQVFESMADPVIPDARFEQQQLMISASVGIAFVGTETLKGRQSAELLREADAAMYEAKAGGRARAETFGPAMHERATRKLALMSDLRGVSERGELELDFQLFVDLREGLPFGSEALLRWRHPTFGLLMPGAFMPIAEESGSLISLGRWAFEEAIRLFAAGTAPGGTLHVNVSVRELLEDGFDAFVAELLYRYGVATSSLAVEVIEGGLIRSGDRAEKMLRRLRTMGVKIWIDDFGVEYSSLRYLHRLPIDGVKIDRTFVGGSDGSLASPTIVRLIIELARSLELAVVAEGIETPRQRKELLALGCRHGQGYLFGTGAPLPPVAVI